MNIPYRISVHDIITPTDKGDRGLLYISKTGIMLSYCVVSVNGESILKKWVLQDINECRIWQQWSRGKLLLLFSPNSCLYNHPICMDIGKHTDLESLLQAFQASPYPIPVDVIEDESKFFPARLFSSTGESPYSTKFSPDLTLRHQLHERQQAMLQDNMPFVSLVTQLKDMVSVDEQRRSFERFQRRRGSSISTLGKVSPTKRRAFSPLQQCSDNGGPSTSASSLYPLENDLLFEASAVGDVLLTPSESNSAPCRVNTQWALSPPKKMLSSTVEGELSAAPVEQVTSPHHLTNGFASNETPKSLSSPHRIATSPSRIGVISPTLTSTQKEPELEVHILDDCPPTIAYTPCAPSIYIADIVEVDVEPGNTESIVPITEEDVLASIFQRNVTCEQPQIKVHKAKKKERKMEIALDEGDANPPLLFDVHPDDNDEVDRPKADRSSHKEDIPLGDTEPPMLVTYSPSISDEEGGEELPVTIIAECIGVEMSEEQVDIVITDEAAQESGSSIDRVIIPGLDSPPLIQCSTPTIVPRESLSLTGSSPICEKQKEKEKRSPKQKPVKTGIAGSPTVSSARKQERTTTHSSSKSTPSKSTSNNSISTLERTFLNIPPTNKSPCVGKSNKSNLPTTTTTAASSSTMHRVTSDSILNVIAQEYLPATTMPNKSPRKNQRTAATVPRPIPTPSASSEVVIIVDSDEDDAEVTPPMREADGNLVSPHHSLADGSDKSPASISQHVHSATRTYSVIPQVSIVEGPTSVSQSAAKTEQIREQVFASLRDSRHLEAYVMSTSDYRAIPFQVTAQGVTVLRPKVSVTTYNSCLNIEVDGRELTFEGIHNIPEPRLTGVRIQRFSYIPPNLEDSSSSSGYLPTSFIQRSGSNSSSTNSNGIASKSQPPVRVDVDNFALLCLNPGAYVNDVVIDFYLTYLRFEVMSPQQRHFSHIFGCFFYNRLLDSSKSKEERHASVSRWTRRVDIFEKDFLFVPVLQNSHWFLCIVCFPWLAGTVDYAVRLSKEMLRRGGDKDTSLELRTPGISQEFLKWREERVKQLNAEGVSPMPSVLIFDSLLGIQSRGLNVDVIRDFLQVEWNQKYASQHGPMTFTKETIRGYIPRVVNQKNGCDCGVFALEYARHFMTSPVKEFTRSCFENLRVSPCEETMNGLQLRANLQDLIIAKFEKYKARQKPS